MAGIICSGIIRSQNPHATSRDHSKEKRDAAKRRNPSPGDSKTKKETPRQNTKRQTDQRAGTEKYPKPPKGERPPNSRRQKLNPSKDNEKPSASTPRSPRSKNSRKPTQDQKKDNTTEPVNTKDKDRDDMQDEGGSDNPGEKDVDGKLSSEENASDMNEEEEQDNKKNLIEHPPVSYLDVLSNFM